MTSEERMKRFMESDTYKNAKLIDDALAAAEQRKPIEVVDCQPLSGYVVTTADGKTHWTKNLVGGSKMDTHLIGEDGKVYIVRRNQ